MEVDQKPFIESQLRSFMRRNRWDEKRSAQQIKQRRRFLPFLIGVAMLVWYVMLPSPWAEANWALPLGIVLVVPFLVALLERND